MVIYFSIYCFLGYLMESCYISLFKQKWFSSGLLKGPYIPIYGFGAIILILLQENIHISPLLLSIIGGLCMTSLEYLTSLYIEKVFHTQCWNYSHLPFHFQGRICLFYTILWCILSGLFLYHLHPWITSLNLMNDLMTIFSLIYLAFMLKAFINQLQFSKRNGLDIL